jgi:hypothetical protein
MIFSWWLCAWWPKRKQYPEELEEIFTQQDSAYRAVA